MSTIALDLGGTRIKIGIVQDGEILDTDLLDSFSDDGLIPRLPFVEAAINKLIQKIGIQKERIEGVGVSVPGIVDSNLMKILSINKKFFDATEIDFNAWALKNWNVPVFVENDARSALVGEWQYGAGKDCNDLVMITLGTGVGGATVMEGKLLRGKHFVAGCLAGHFTVNYHGNVCNCGNLGCVESEASTWSIGELAKNHSLYSSSALSKVSTIDFEQIFTHSEKGDSLAKVLVKHSLDVWSAGVVNLIHAYDPEKLIIGGGIMKSANVIIPYVQNYVNKHAWTPWGKVEVVCAKHPDWAGLQGVDYLCANMIKD